MRRYETIAIIDPDLNDDGRAPLLARTQELIVREGGFVIELDEWGNKKLAYTIKKKPRGYYVRWEFCGDGPLINELERSFRIDDRVMKYMTVLLEKQADVEQIKAQLAAAEQEKAEEEQQSAATTTDTPDAESSQAASAANAPATTESQEEV